jgi:hypothetical protein
MPDHAELTQREEDHREFPLLALKACRFTQIHSDDLINVPTKPVSCIT